MKLSLALVACAAVLAGCASMRGGSVPPLPSAAAVTQASARWPDASASSIAAGRELFASKCNACHDYPNIDTVPEERWPGLVSRMGDNAHLDTKQRQALLRFILTARTPTPTDQATNGSTAPPQ